MKVSMLSAKPSTATELRSISSWKSTEAVWSLSFTLEWVLT
jgi:hypothetical protein